MQLKATMIKNKWQRLNKCKTMELMMTMKLLNSSRMMNIMSKCSTIGRLSQEPIPCLDSISTKSMTLDTSLLSNKILIMSVIRCRWMRDRI